MILKFVSPFTTQPPPEEPLPDVILPFRPLPGWKPRRKPLNQHLSEIAEYSAALHNGDETARNQVIAGLTALYWKFGRDIANKAMDYFQLGRLGFKRWEL